MSENWIEQGVLEFLSDNGAGAPAKPASEAQPFEIAVVITNNNPALVRIDLGKSLKLDVTEEIFRSKPRAPHQIKHGLGKMLIGFANDAALF